jgi:hypothetical protein
MKLTKSAPLDVGSAALEFLVFGLVAQLVLTGFGLDLLRQQRAQIVSQSIARQAVRLVIADPANAPARVQEMLDQIRQRQGRVATNFSVSWLPRLPVSGDWVVATANVSGHSEIAVMKATR